MEHWFWKYAFENKNVYIQAGIATLLVNLFALVIGFFVMVVYDRIIPSNALTSLVGLFVGASVIILLRYALELLKTYFLDYAGQTIERKTSESVFDKIMRYDLLRAPKSNGSVAALVKDFETFQQFFTSVTLLLLIDIPFMFLFLYVIYLIGGAMVYVPLLIIPMVIFVGLVVQPRQRAEDPRWRAGPGQTSLPEHGLGCPSRRQEGREGSKQQGGSLHQLSCEFIPCLPGWRSDHRPPMDPPGSRCRPMRQSRSPRSCAGCGA